MGPTYKKKKIIIQALQSQYTFGIYYKTPERICWDTTKKKNRTYNIYFLNKKKGGIVYSTHQWYICNFMFFFEMLKCCNAIRR